MGMIHCTQTDRSLVRELFQDATQTVPTGPCFENISKKEWKRRKRSCAKKCHWLGSPLRSLKKTASGADSHLTVDGNVAVRQRNA